MLLHDTLAGYMLVWPPSHTQTLIANPFHTHSDRTSEMCAGNIEWRCFTIVDKRRRRVVRLSTVGNAFTRRPTTILYLDAGSQQVKKASLGGCVCLV